jgi:threonine/homoserine/homoserine lactone efflux protein
MLGLGVFFAEHYQTLLAYIGQVKLFLLVAGIAVLAFIGYRCMRHKTEGLPELK